MYDQYWNRRYIILKTSVLKFGYLVVVIPLLYALLIPVSYLFASPPQKGQVGFNFQAGNEETGRVVAGIPFTITGNTEYNNKPIQNANITIYYVENGQRISIEMEKIRTEASGDDYKSIMTLNKPGKHSLQIVAMSGNITGALDWIIDVEEH
jgi:hypothetical protein